MNKTYDAAQQFVINSGVKVSSISELHEFHEWIQDDFLKENQTKGCGQVQIRKKTI